MKVQLAEISRIAEVVTEFCVSSTKSIRICLQQFSRFPIKNLIEKKKQSNQEMNYLMNCLSEIQNSFIIVPTGNSHLTWDLPNLKIPNWSLVETWEVFLWFLFFFISIYSKIRFRYLLKVISDWFDRTDLLYVLEYL